MYAKAVPKEYFFRAQELEAYCSKQGWGLRAKTASGVFAGYFWPERRLKTLQNYSVSV